MKNSTPLEAHTGARRLSTHKLFDRFQIDRWLSRDGSVVWMVNDLARAGEDFCGFGVELHQGAARPNMIAIASKALRGDHFQNKAERFDALLGKLANLRKRSPRS